MLKRREVHQPLRAFHSTPNSPRAATNARNTPPGSVCQSWDPAEQQHHDARDYPGGGNLGKRGDGHSTDLACRRARMPRPLQRRPVSTMSTATPTRATT